MTFPLALTFDDILLLPGYTEFSRSDISLKTRLTRNIELQIPLVSSPMDTVTEAELAIALAKLGGIGIIHRNLSVGDQVEEVRKVLHEKLLVGAAVGAAKGFEERVEALVNVGIPVIVVDSAHGYAKNVIDATRFIKSHFPEVDVIARDEDQSALDAKQRSQTGSLPPADRDRSSNGRQRWASQSGARPRHRGAPQ